MRNSNESLWRAIEDREAETVRRLLHERPELVEWTDAYGFTPLMRAASCCDRTLEVIEAILLIGGNSPFCHAARIQNSPDS